MSQGGNDAGVGQMLRRWCKPKVAGMGLRVAQVLVLVFDLAGPRFTIRLPPPSSPSFPSFPSFPSSSNTPSSSNSPSSPYSPSPHNIRAEFGAVLRGRKARENQ